MSSIRLTEEGKKILVGQHDEGTTRYWVGYFGLAYVPKKVGSADESLVGADEEGDYIYNIWQGDLAGTGYASGLSRATLYDRNLLSNFRYVYDAENHRNRLVAWESSGEVSYVRTGYHVYDGVGTGTGNDVDAVTPGEIPVPAPLFYTGLDYAPPEDEQDFADEMGSDWPKLTDSGEKKAYPNVSADMRYYGGGLAVSGSEFDSGVTGSGDYIASNGQAREGSPVLDQYVKFVSVSKFNKSHGPVSSEGYAVTGAERTRNMSRATKLFPISKYEVTASKNNATGTTSDGSQVAEAVKYRVELDFTGGLGGALQAYRDTISYEGDGVYSGGSGNSFKFNRIGIYAVQANIRHFYASEAESVQGNCRAGYYQVEILPDVNPVLFAIADVEETSMSDDGKFGQQKFGMDFILNLATPTGDTGVCNNAEVYYNLAENEAITWYQNQLLASAGISEAVTNLQVNMAHMMNRPEGKEASSGTVVQTASTDTTQFAPKAHSHSEYATKAQITQNTPEFSPVYYDTVGSLELSIEGGHTYWYNHLGGAQTGDMDIVCGDMKDGDEAVVWLPNANSVYFRAYDTGSQQGRATPVRRKVMLGTAENASAPAKGCWVFRRATYVDSATGTRTPGLLYFPLGAAATKYMNFLASL